MTGLVIYGDTSGSIALQANAIAGTNTLTLPANTGVLLSNASSINAASITSGTLPKAQLPTGSVLQVVSSAYSTPTSVSSSTYADTGLSATITPTSASSKILVLVAHTTVQIQSSNTGAGFKLLRNGSSLLTFGFYVAFTGASPAYYDGGVPLCYLDSPANTSALTYKTQFNSEQNSASVTLQPNNITSTITLMEIAA